MEVANLHPAFYAAEVQGHQTVRKTQILLISTNHLPHIDPGPYSIPPPASGLRSTADYAGIFFPLFSIWLFNNKLQLHAGTFSVLGRIRTRATLSLRLPARKHLGLEISA